MKLVALLIAVLGLSGCIAVPVYDGPGYGPYYGGGYYYGHRPHGYWRYRDYRP